MNSIDESVKYQNAVDKNATVDDAIQYAKDVLSKKIISGKLLIQACRRFINDLEHGDSRGIKFSRNKADRALKFFPVFCCHIKGELKGEPMILEPWQAFIVVQIFGFHKKNSKGKWVRRFRTVYIEVARKNGKSTLVSGIAIYMLAFDGEGGAEVWCAAVDKDQAKIVWDAAAAMAELNPVLRDLLKLTKSKSLLELTSNYSKFAPLSKETKKMDGLNVHCGILDELHAHRTREVFDLVSQGMGSRVQPLLLIITTAGVNIKGICYEQRQYVARILDEEDELTNETYLGVIFSVDDEDDPYDEKQWPKANPCLGIAKTIDAMRINAELSKISCAAKINFLIKDLNSWVDGGVRWINSKEWAALGETELPDNLDDLDCWLGVDLSICGDLTAIAQFFKGEGIWYLKTDFYYPQAAIDKLEPEQKAMFEKWIADGYLNVIDGHQIDNRVIKDRIIELCGELKVKEICIDRWNADAMILELNELDYPAIAIEQNTKNLSPAMKQIENLINGSFINHDNNPVMNWMMGNVVTTIDINDNYYPKKADDNRRNKIDGASALFNAACRGFIDGGEADISDWLGK